MLIYIVKNVCVVDINTFLTNCSLKNELCYVHLFFSFSFLN